MRQLRTSLEDSEDGSLRVFQDCCLAKLVYIGWWDKHLTTEFLGTFGCPIDIFYSERADPMRCFSRRPAFFVGSRWNQAAYWNSVLCPDSVRERRPFKRLRFQSRHFP